MNNSISVVMPVYNAADFVEEAVLSAIELNEVLEVLMIEDNSPDHSLSICLKMEKKHDKVKLLRHADGKNHGAGHSRNLGINNAKGNFIAFLDADDYYLSNRFQYIDKLVDDKKIDGMYGVVGTTYQDSASKSLHLKRMSDAKKNILSCQIPLEDTGMESNVASKNLFNHLLRTDLGWIHLNALTLKKESLVGIQLFNNAYLGQDSEFIIRLSSIRNLINVGHNEPVATRRVHSGNRILNTTSRKIKKTAGYSYWIWYCVSNKRWGKELWYLTLRQSDRISKTKKAFILLVNLTLIFVGYLSTKKIKLY